MTNPFLLVGLGVVVFASTNVDDIFVLLGFLSDPRFRTRQVVMGQYVGIATLVAASVAVSFSALVIPTAYVGLLGFAPLGIGVWKLFAREDSSDEELAEPRRSSVVAVAAVTIANGGDNLGVYTPLFATRSAWEASVLVVVFLVMTGLWCALARYLVQHRTLGLPIRKYGRVFLPWVLMALGVYILIDSGSHRLLPT